MIVFGGQKSDSDLLAILQIYDFENDEWNVQSYEG